MSRYRCVLCGFVYDEEKGIPEAGISPGTLFKDLPDNWVCPLCGSPKSEFELIADDHADRAVKPESKRTQSAACAVAASIPSGEGEDRLREMSFGEMADMCSNLQRGCEKQYLYKEAALFKELSDHYRSKTADVSDVADSDLLALINDNLSRYDDANEAASKANDRGAKRVLLWSEKVGKVLQSLMERYGSEGSGMIANTNVYVCDICGFIYVGDEPPAICPICKVPSLKLLKVERRQ